MFKFRRSRGKLVPGDDDDNEPMRIIKNKRGVQPPQLLFGSGGGGGGARQQQQHRARSSSLGREGRVGKDIHASSTYDTASDTETWAATEFGGSTGSEGSSDLDSTGAEVTNSNSIGNNFVDRAQCMQGGGASNNMKMTHPPAGGDAAQAQKDRRQGSKSNIKQTIPTPQSRRRSLSDHGLNDSQVSMDNSARSNNSRGVGGGNGTGGNTAITRGTRSRSSSHPRGGDVSDSAAAPTINNSTAGNTQIAPSFSSKVLPNINTINSINPSHNDNKEAGEESMKLKPPSIRGVARPLNQPKRGQVGNTQFRRSSSADSIPATSPITSPNTPLTTPTETGTSSRSGNSAEFAAMQQLAHIVVGLRTELRAATLARDDLETKLKSLQKDGSPNSIDIKCRVLERENADLQADIDAFIAEQDDLKSELRELQEDKHMLNDLISRLKTENGRLSITSKVSSGSTATNNHVRSSHHNSFKSTTESVQDLDERIHFLTEENHNLESELQLLVNEKSVLVNSGDTRNCEIQQLRSIAKETALHHSEVLAEKDRAIHGLQEKIDSLKGKCGRLEKECRERKTDVELLEGLVAQQDEELNLFRDMPPAELQKKGEEIKLLQQKLGQVENEKNEVNDRYLALEHIMLGLKKKVELLLKERDTSKLEMDELKLSFAGSISDQASESASNANLKSQQNVISEANNVIAMLKDELDRKDVEVNELVKAMASLKEQISHAQESITSLHEQNATMKSDYDAALEEIEKLQSLQTKDGDDERASIHRKLSEDMNALLNELSEVRRKSNGKVLALQKEISELQAGKEKLEHDLDDSSEAIFVLRETLKEMENGRIARDSKIRELRASIEEKELSLKDAESTRTLMQSEHQVNVDTIATLQKMISSLESSQEDLEEELNASALAIHDLKDQLKMENKAGASDFEEMLKLAHEENAKLTERVSELTEVNKRMKNEVKDLGNILARSSAMNDAGNSTASLMASGLISSDPSASCDALISELKKQIKNIVSARNAALKEVEMLRNDSVSLSEATMPPPSPVVFKRAISSEVAKSSSLTTLPEDSDEPSIKTGEKSTTANSSSPSSTGSRGSSLLEAAKKLCDKLDEKRSKEFPKTVNTTPTEPALSGDSRMNGVKRLPSRDEVQVVNVVDQDEDIASTNEVKDDSPKETTDNGEVNAKSPSSTPAEGKTSSRPRVDIDQLSHIYMEKCGLSRFSDISSDSSRRLRKPHKTITTAKKVKICRNGVFMGTYEGDLNAEGQRHGCGVLLCDNGNSYEGEWKNDKRDGFGTARYSSGDVYDGQWQRGRRHGHGVMYIEAGDTYIGSWKNGLKHGE